MKKKPSGPKWLLLLVAFSLICSTVMMGVVQATLSPVNPVPWPTEKQPNPVEQKIAEFRAKGMTDDQIIEELRKFGMGWNPESGATAVGIVRPPGGDMPPRPNPYLFR